MENVQQIIKKNATPENDFNYPENIDGKSALVYIGAEINATDIVQLLIENNAQVNRKNYRGQTPLSVASGSGYTQVVKLLVDNNAEVDPFVNHTIMYRASDWYEQSALYEASRYGHTDIIAILIENKAAVNQLYGSESPLYFASRYNYLEIVKLLIENNADINLANDEGKTPLYVASLNGHLEALNLFLELIKLVEIFSLG